nr:hypothetical protein 13E11.180 [imported] - Neurospora crassa [Neurospora crassa]
MSLTPQMLIPPANTSGHRVKHCKTTVAAGAGVCDTDAKTTNSSELCKISNVFTNIVTVDYTELSTQRIAVRRSMRRRADMVEEATRIPSACVTYCVPTMSPGGLYARWPAVW